jgi:hypothetical protein
LVTIICAKRGFDAHLIPASGYQDIHDFSVRNGARSSGAAITSIAAHLHVS